MAHATISAPLGAQRATRTKQTATVLAWASIVALAVGFVIKYVLFYYRHYDAASFDPYWPRRRNMTFHRWTGRLFLLGVAMGVTGSVGSL